jgi:hypothetical protein
VRVQENEDRLPTAILAARRKLTVPRQVCVELGLKIGDRIKFVRTMNGHYVLLPVYRQ